jgi:hypothetical protein
LAVDLFLRKAKVDDVKESCLKFSWCMRSMDAMWRSRGRHVVCACHSMSLRLLHLPIF